MLTVLATRISILTVVIFFILTLLTLLLDFLGPLIGVKKYKASKYSVIGSFLGFFAGVLLLGIWGIILGPVIGALVRELIAGGTLSRDSEQHWGHSWEQSSAI